MSNISLFLKPAEFYKREISPLLQYVDQSAFFLTKMLGGEYEDWRKTFVDDLKARTGPFTKMVDPVVQHFERDEFADRHVRYTRLTQYIRKINEEAYVLAPTGTAYTNHTKRLSPLAKFMEHNKRHRSKAKKESQAAKAAGDMIRFEMKDNEQATAKGFNNSTSGGFATKGCALHNPTAHSTLTSATRSISSIANAINEKLLAGNRHYRTPEITLNNLVALSYRIDAPAIRSTMAKFGLVYPTADQVMEMVRWSTQLYWGYDKRSESDIRAFVDTLTDVERAAVVYSGDLYHIRKFNPKFVDKLMSSMAYPDKVIRDTDGHIVTLSMEEIIKELRSSDEQIVNFVHQSKMSIFRGIGKSYEKLSHADATAALASVRSAVVTVESYRQFFDTFFLTEALPASVAHIPDMVRRVVVLSDTDSTMFSCDEWVEWKFGDVRFDDEAFAWSAVAAYITTQCIGHGLALFSGHCGVDLSRIFLMSMKPEFMFGFHGQTAVAKHYFAPVMVKEGNVYAEFEAEIKGVHLKNSASPPDIVKPFHVHLNEIMSMVLDNKKISIIEEIRRAIAVENMIRTALMNSSIVFLKRQKINLPDAYSKGPDESPYQWHTFWNEVWGPSYQMWGDPPYGTVKIPISCPNATQFMAWVDSFSDKALAARYKVWLVKKGKRQMKTFYLSEDYVKAFGIPKEIIAVIDWRRIVLDLTVPYRMVLDMLGMPPKPGLLVMEQFPQFAPEDAIPPRSIMRCS